jgi:hypothetical protein
MSSVTPLQGSKVIVTEINLSQVIAATSSSVAGQVVVSAQGSAFPQNFTDPNDYLNAYGNPNAQISFDQYCALDYFKEGNNLWSVRALGTGYAYAAVLMYTDGTLTYLTPIEAGVATPTEPDFTALLPSGNYTALALFYPLQGPGSFGDAFAIGIVSANLTTPAWAVNPISSTITGGSLPPATYQYQVSAFNSVGETLATNPVTIVIAGSSVTNAVTLSWSAVSGAQGYYVYGRTSTTVFLIAQVGAGTTTFTDTGAITPESSPNPNQQPITSAADVTTSPFFTVQVFNANNGLVYPAETYTCSFEDNTSSQGTETELEQAINPFSATIQVTSNIPNLLNPPTIATSVAPTSMAGGNSGGAPTDSDIINAWQVFINKQLYPVNICINSGHFDPAIQQAMDTLVQARGDSIALLDTPSTEQQSQQAINYRNLQLNLNSTYSALFCPDVLEPDTINGKQLYVPFSGWAAALCARTDRVANPSFSIAGLNRGLVNVLATRYTYNQGEMDNLFDAQVNYTQTFVGQGIALWEQQTLSGEFSALSWLSVRRITNVIKVALYNFLLYSLQEPNDQFTGLQIVGSCTAYLQSIQNARGISGFTVVSDNSNNSAQDFNSGIRNVTVVIIPVIPIHIINLQVVISKQGVSFAEVLSQVNPG